ncbi:MAG: RNA methyltransferase [Deferrisomatales bacterium]
MAVICSSGNERLRWVRRLAESRKARRREGLWVAEGVRLAEELVARGLPVRLWLVEEGWGREGGRAGTLRSRVEQGGAPLLEVRRGLLCQIADTQHPQGILAVFEAPRWREGDVLGGSGPVVILDRLQDPGNLGTIARTAEAAGAAGLLLLPGTADPGNPKALRASAGSLLRLPVARAGESGEPWRRGGRRVLAAAGRGGIPYDRLDLAEPFALVLGQEGSGVSPALLARADQLVTVPMEGAVESLNVAATAAAILFEAARQRRQKTP